MELYVVNDDSDKEPLSTNDTLITVVGIGGGGTNAINRMIASNMTNINFIAMNTDKQSLTESPANHTLVLGERVTAGLGAGGDPEVGEKAAQEDAEVIEKLLTGSDMVFITTGMGGGTGTGATPVIASIAKKLNILTVAVVTRPFSFEGERRQNIANNGIEKLRKNVDGIIIIPNDKISKDISIDDSFKQADEILHQGIQGISDIITKSGTINLDFADVRSTMKDMGDSFLGIGVASGANRASEAALAALDNPLLAEMDIRGAKKLLVSVTFGADGKINEYEEALKVVRERINNTDIDNIPGIFRNNKLENELRVTIIATGFNKSINVHEEVNKLTSEEELQKQNVTSLTEWKNMFTSQEAQQSEFTFGANENNSFNKEFNNIRTPAFLRRQRKINNRNMQ